MNSLLALVTPNVRLPRQSQIVLTLSWLVLVLACWSTIPLPFLPTPVQILSAFSDLRTQGVFLEFGTSIWTMLESIFWTLVLSLGLAYASVIPVVNPAVSFISRLRYLGLVGLMLAFTLMAPDGHALKVMILTFGMTVFYLPDMMQVIDNIPKEQYDHARTLGMGPFRALYEVAILGTMDSALESLRVNAAMGWMMLTMVEGVVRSEGGIGVALLNMNRHMDLAAEGAILIVLFCVGWFQDWAIGFLKDYIICPWAKLGKGQT